MTRNTVFNLTFDSNASQKSIEKAAKQVVDAVEKGTQHVVDVSKNPQKVIDAIKAGSEKIVDAVGKIKTTHNNQSIPIATATVLAGLQSVAESTTKIAAHLRSHPAELGAMEEKAEAVNKQFGDCIGSNFSNGGGGNVQTIPVSNNAFAALWQQYGN